jgi:5'-phosphate synthase pdxT subunit
VLIGLLALQGDYRSHQKVLDSLGIESCQVRSVEDLDNIDGLIIPGGESTVMSRLCERYGIFAPLQKKIEDGFPCFGTCAGLIFLAKEISGASQNFEQKTLGALDIEVERNAYGAQLDSFETELEVKALDETIHGVFIRAPRISRVGEGVEVLVYHEENGVQTPVVVRHNLVMAASFHPELAGETRLHQLWLDAIYSAQSPSNI